LFDALRQHLERDGLTEFQIVRTIDFAHSARADNGDDSKSIVD